jgi:serine O-acetyltransferase
MSQPVGSDPQGPDPQGLRDLIRADYRQFCRLSKLSETRGAWRALLGPRTLPVVLMRLAGWLYHSPARPLGSFVALLNLMLFRVEIPARAQIGAGFVLPHPMGIVLGAAVIGRNVTCFQNVTLGARSFDGAYDLSTRPRIGDNVIIGAGAVVLGPVTLGEGCVVAANALVLMDVPARTTAIGNPARISGAQITKKLSQLSDGAPLSTAKLTAAPPPLPSASNDS